jgi:hypothetical protein
MMIRIWPAAIASVLLAACAASPQKPPAAAAPPPVAATADHKTNAAYDPRIAASQRKAREMGYHREIRHGEEFFCRSVAPLGSRFEQKECLTPDGMAQAVQMAEENQMAQRQGQLCQGAGCVRN